MQGALILFFCHGLMVARAGRRHLSGGQSASGSIGAVLFEKTDHEMLDSEEIVVADISIVW